MLTLNLETRATRVASRALRAFVRIVAWCMFGCAARVCVFVAHGAAFVISAPHNSVCALLISCMRVLHGVMGAGGDADGVVVSLAWLLEQYGLRSYHSFLHTSGIITVAAR